MGTRFRLSTLQVLVIGFALVIVIGGALLSMPFSNRDEQGIPFINGLFTATSATCVKGLIVYDTYTQFNLLGQVITSTSSGSRQADPSHQWSGLITSSQMTST